MVMPEDKLYEVLGRYVERPEFRNLGSSDWADSGSALAFPHQRAR